ncbi:MAG: hypothetical protein KDD35_02195, partial [Bdellovibrionales bacterium]|nr:hypothetical protein [Bdellovibrionales bacterium]
YISPHLHQIFSDQEKSDIFCHYLSHLHDKPLDSSDPLELFGALVQAFYRAAINPDPNKAISTNQIIENPELVSFMRNEIGMFKHEQAMVAKALHMQSTLRKKDDFERRGERRQMAVLQTEAFPLALQFASRDYSLSGEKWLFWTQHYEKSRDKIQIAQKRVRRKKKRTSSYKSKTSRTGSE